MMHGLAKVGFTPVVHLLHLAQHASRSSTEYLTELATAAGARVLPAELLAEHARHPAEYLQHGGRPRSRARSCSPRRSSRATASTGRLRAVEHAARGRAARSTSTRRSTSCAHWDSIAPTASRRSSRAQPVRRENPALQPTAACASTRPTTTRCSCYTKQADDGGRHVVLVVVNLDPHQRRPAGSTLDLDDLGSGRRRCPSRCTTC